MSKTNSTPWAKWASVNTNIFARIGHRLNNDWSLRFSYNRGDYDADEKPVFVFGSPDRGTGLGMGSYPVTYGSARVQDDLGAYGSGQVTLFGKQHEVGFAVTTSRQTFSSTARFALSVPDVGDFNTWDGSYPEPAWDSPTPWQDSRSRDTAGYGVVRLSLTQPLKAILGVRLSSLARDGEYFVEGGSFDISHKAITPYAGVVWTLNRHHSLYASYADIFQPQYERDRNARYLDPINGNTYEGGIKGEYLGGRLNVGLAVFHILQDNAAQLDPWGFVAGTQDELVYYSARGATTPSSDRRWDSAGSASVSSPRSSRASRV